MTRVANKLQMRIWYQACLCHGSATCCGNVLILKISLMGLEFRRATSGAWQSMTVCDLLSLCYFQPSRRLESSSTSRNTLKEQLVNAIARIGTPSRSSRRRGSCYTAEAGWFLTSRTSGWKEAGKSNLRPTRSAGSKIYFRGCDGVSLNSLPCDWRECSDGE